MINRILKISFYTIFLSFWGYVLIYYLFLMTPIGGNTALISWGISIVLSACFLFLLRDGSILKAFFVGALFTFLLILGIIFLVEAPFFTIFIIFIISTGLFGIFNLRKGVLTILNHMQSAKRQSSPIEKRFQNIMILSLIIGTVFIAIPFLVPKTETYSVSQEQAANTEIVLYWHTKNYEELNTSLVDICKTTNTVLSLNLMEYNFVDGNPRGEKCADIIAYANNQGVKIEVYPIFEKDRGWYVSYSETNILMDLYYKFSNWTTNHSLIVDYFLFDIEPSLENEPYLGWVNGIPLFEDIGQMAFEVNNMHTRQKNWIATLEEWKKVIEQIKSDGLIPRATIPPYYYDLLDGDSDVQIKGGTPAFDLVNEFQYISMMLYRGCEWGNNDPQEYLSRAVETRKKNVPGPIAACIGCLNFKTYQTEDSILNDIYLIISKGANSVRIFEGSYWIIGTDYGEGHDLASLESILIRARNGGSSQYKSSGSFQIVFAGAVLLDVLLNTM